MLNCRIVMMLILLMVIIPTPARSHANFADVPSLAGTRIRDVLDEPDPDDNGDCLSLGELDIVFRTGNDGPPDVGVVLTDPRGRRIGFDPLIKHAWQALPVAQGDINCDDLDLHELFVESIDKNRRSSLAKSKEVLDGNKQQRSLRLLAHLSRYCPLAM